MHDAGFPLGGEPLVALDLADTLLTVPDPPLDLLDDPDRYRRWWGLQERRLPQAPAPSVAATRRLRTAVREVFDAVVDGRAPAAARLEDLNSVAAAVPTSPRLTSRRGGLIAEQRWHTEHGGNAALAAIARETIDLLGDDTRRPQLRRCANPGCSMVFLAVNRRRVWCTANLCGNRTRVARHHARSAQG